VAGPELQEPRIAPAEGSENGSGSLGGTPVHVQLGDHSYAVYAQRVGYLENRIGSTVSKLGTLNIEGVEELVTSLGGSAYGLLKVFIPRLMPEHEFRGYPTEEAHAAREYDERYDKSPSFAQIVTAFQTAMRVNRFDLFGSLKNLLSPELLRAMTNKAVAESVQRGLPSPSGSSTSTPDTTSTPSGTTAPTSIENSDSPSPA
jgi:hypothetical protein